LLKEYPIETVLICMIIFKNVTAMVKLFDNNRVLSFVLLILLKDM